MRGVAQAVDSVNSLELVPPNYRQYLTTRTLKTLFLRLNGSDSRINTDVFDETDILWVCVFVIPSLFP